MNPQVPMGGQLPFDINRQTSQARQLNPGNPHILPTIQNLPISLQNYYPLIVTELINAIQAKATNSYVRIFLFNQMASNDYNNIAFQGLCADAVRLVDYQIQNNRFPTYEAAIADSCTAMVEFMAAKNTYDYPALSAYLDPQAQEGVRSVLQTYQQVTMQMNQFFQMRQASPMVHTPHLMQQPMQQPMMRGHANPALAAGSLTGHMNTQGTPIQNYSTGNVLLDQQNSRFVEDVAPPPAPIQQPQQVVAPPPPPDPDKPVYVHATDVGAGFKPTALGFVSIAYNPRKNVLVYHLEKGNMLPKIGERSPAMKIEDHVLFPSYMKQHPAATTTVEDELSRYTAVEAFMAKEKVGLSTEDGIKFVKESEQNFSTSSIVEHWTSNEARMLAMGNEANYATVYRTEVAHIQTMVSSIDPEESLTLLDRATTFAEAGRLMRLFKEQAQAKGPEIDIESVNKIDQRLTRSVNDYLKRSLATKAKASSFMMDAHEIIDYVGKKYGEVFKEALIKDQKMIIARAISRAMPLSGFAEDLTLAMFSSEEYETIKDKVCLTHFYEQNTTTSVDLMAYELQFELPYTEMAVGIIEKATPLLFAIATNTWLYAAAKDFAYTHHFLRTSDGLVLEFTRSAINNDFYLVSAVTHHTA